MWKLFLKGSSDIPIEADSIIPDRFMNQSIDKVAQLPLQHGNRSIPLGDWFEIQHDPSQSDDQIEIHGDCSRIKRIGNRMSLGKIHIVGNVGMHLGAEMNGGEIQVEGNTSDWTGAEMRKGRIWIHGHAGNNLGGAYLGSVRGMRGGEIFVTGHVGYEAGATLRRGLICIGGDAGEFLGASMIAGTIVVCGPLADRAGVGMKRGTIVALGSISSLIPTFRMDCEYQPRFLGIYFRHLQANGFPLPTGLDAAVFRRYSGDLVSLGQGEILERIS